MTSPGDPERAARPSDLNGGQGSTQRINGAAGLRNAPHLQHYAPQTDPLIESLDGHDDVEQWLNDVVRTRRAAVLTLSQHSLHGVAEEAGSGERAASSGPTAKDSLGNLESQLSSLSTTLSIARQDTLSVIDNTISEVTATMPRLGLELRLMKDAAMTLKTSIDQLKAQAMDHSGEQAGRVASAAAGPSSSSQASSSAATSALERLSALSTLHSRMTAARDVLSLAESWSTLSADVTSYLSEAKYVPACSRLAEAKSSLAVFERTPEYESRKQLLEGLCNSLVSTIAPSLETAIAEKDVAQAQRIASTFSAIGRDNEFGERWRKGRTRPWLAQWNSARPSEEVGPGGLGSEISFVQLLPSLLDSYLVLLNEERLFAPSLFAQDPRKSLQVFTLTALQALDPPLKKRALHSMQSHHHEALLALVSIHTAVKNAAAGIVRAIGRVEGRNAEAPLVVPNGAVYHYSPTAMSPRNENKAISHATPSPVSPTTARPRQSSYSQRSGSNRRLSVNLTPNPKSSGANDAAEDMLTMASSSTKQKPVDALLALLGEPAEWEEQLLEPLVELQLDYGRLERSYLTHEAEKESIASEGAVGAESSDSRTLVGSRIGRLLREDCRIARALAEDATVRSISLTYGLASDELVACIDQLYLVNLDKFCIRLEQRSRDVVQLARTQASGKLEGARDGMHGGSSVEEDQWKAFEDSVGLLATMHHVEQSIEGVEGFLAEKLKDSGEMILSGAGGTASEAVLRLCGQSTKAPLAILARHCSERLRSSSLAAVLENARIVAKESRTSLAAANTHRHSLLSGARQSLAKQLNAVQQHLIDMALAPLMSYMEFYTQLSIWEANRLPGSVNEYELAMPTFSLSPTEEMSRIGEGLLDLPRLLEVWSDNADLRWAVRGLPFVFQSEEQQVQAQEKVGGTEQADANAPSGPSSSPLLSNKRMSFHPGSSPTLDRRTSSHRHTASLAAIATVSANPASPNGPEDGPLGDGGDQESVLQTYLSCIALSLLAHLTSLVLPSIATITAAGASQLVADLEYLLNILSALNVNVNPANAAHSHSTFLIRSLEAWKDSCKLKDADGRRVINFVRSGQLARGAALTGIEGFQEDEDRLKSLAGTQAFDMVAKMRGW